MAKSPKTKDVTGLSIRTQGVKSFCRCGRRFGEQATTIPLVLLTKEQVAILKAEKRLQVEEISISVADDSAEA